MPEEERFVVQHLLARDQRGFELLKHFGLLGGPLIDAAAAKLALFVAQEKQAIGFSDHFLPINIVQFESQPFHVVLDVTPKDLLHADPIVRKKTKREFL